MTDTKASKRERCDLVGFEGPVLTVTFSLCAFLPFFLWRADIAILGEKLYKTESGREFEPSVLEFFSPLLIFSSSGFSSAYQLNCHSSNPCFFCLDFLLLALLTST